MPVLYGVHPVAEALRAARPLDRILIAKGAGGTRIQEIVDLARRASVPVRFEPRDALDRLATSAAHQGVVALGAASKYADLDAATANAKLLVILDGVEDPHNLGAIARSAHAAGADAIVIPERRAAGLTDTVAKAAAGALEHLPVARVTNINRTLESLKEQGYWIYGLDERGSELYNEVKWATPTALVFGAEGHGLHDQVRKKCDVLVKIPMAGAIASLNVSVAAGIVLFRWREQIAQARAAEEGPVIRYAVHIAGNAEKVWGALTNAEALRANWGRIESNWTEGSPVTEVSSEGKLRWQGEVVRSEAPRLLSFTFDVVDSGEAPTLVTFEIAEAAAVKLTVTQSGFARESKLFADCSRAWPEILSSFKSYLETGQGLPFSWKD